MDIKRAKDLKVGDYFTHDSTIKIPRRLKVLKINKTPKGRIIVTPESPYSDYKFTFEAEEKI